MSGELERLLIRLEADTTAMRRALAQADRDVGKFAGDVGRKVSNTEKSFTRLGASFRTALGGLAIGAAAKQAGELADAYTRMGNRLTVVAKSAGDLEHVQRRLFQISQEARVDLESTADVYSRYAFALKDAGMTTNETLQFTEALSKAVVVSGASTAEAAGAMLQLSQGLAAGVLRGQELNSVMEQMPIVADLIARQLGVTTGELKKMGEQGQITRKQVVDAVLNGLTELDEKFKKTTPTIGQGFTQLSNSTLEFVGRISEATGASNALASALGAIANKIAEANEELKQTGTLSIWEQIKNVPQWMVDRLAMRPLPGPQPAKPGLGMLGAGVGLQGNIRPPEITAGAGQDPWNTTVLPPTYEEQLREAKEMWDQLRESQMLTLDDLVSDKTETAAEKMRRLTEAVREGSIGWGDYADMVRDVQRQNERANDAMLNSTTQFLDTMFEGNKTAATASALINTYQGITKALSAYPPPYSYAMAAMQAAMGFAQVRAIQNTSKNGKGGGGSVASSAGGASAGTGGGEAPVQRSMFVQGLDPSQLYSGKQVQNIAEALLEFQRNGGQVFLGSRG